MARPELFRFPNPVDERTARLVAAGVLVQAAGFLITRWPVLLVALALGFVLRVLSGPRLSPLALVVTRLVVPRLPAAPKLVPGPPKRFAQGIGATLSTGALVAWLVGAAGLALVLVGLIAVAATLESVFALCIGCKVFAGLMRVHVIPESVCVECANVGARLHEQMASAAPSGAGESVSVRRPVPGFTTPVQEAEARSVCAHPGVTGAGVRHDQ